MEGFARIPSVTFTPLDSLIPWVETCGRRFGRLRGCPGGCSSSPSGPALRRGRSGPMSTTIGRSARCSRSAAGVATRTRRGRAASRSRTFTAVIAGGEKFGAAVVPGHPERSPLVQVLRGTKKPRMPLRGSLTEEEIGRVETWVRQLSAAEAKAGDRIGREGLGLQEAGQAGAPRRQARRLGPQSDRRLRPEEARGAGLEPAPPAEKRVLARRVYLDLVGIVPSPEELDAFLNDDSPRAYEALVDTLLDDPRYGERWGRHWLDLVRYGETSGLEGDGPIGNAWRYRDWVIDAFNRRHAVRPVRDPAARRGRRAQQDPVELSARRPGAHPHRVPAPGPLGPLEPRRRPGPAELPRTRSRPPRARSSSD